MIKRLIIKNFRSIQNLDIELNEINAIIGPNSSGKSNILKAINLVLGQTYATIKSFSKEDFYNFDENNHITIEVHFKKALKCDHQVRGFRLFNDGNSVTYIALDDSGNPCTYSNGSEKKVTNQMRDEVSLIYITLDRLATQQIKPSQWTLYGKLLSYINSSISQNDSISFITNLGEVYNNNVYPYVEEVENLLADYVQELIGRKLILNLSIIDPLMILKNLRPRIAMLNGFDIDIDYEGAGVQSAVTIAIARAYATVTQMPLIMSIEEPEIFLHPHGCRHFYSVLKSLSANGIQVLYTTHRETFVDIKEYQNIKIVYKNNLATEVKSFNGNVNNFDEIKIASKFNLEMNEVFFAEKVILVEGPADKIAIKIALEKLEKSLDQNNISVIECGSISGIKPMIELLNKFDISCLVVVDEDPDNIATQNHIEEIKKILKDPQKDLFVQKPNLEGLLNYNGKFKKETALKEIPLLFEKNDIPDLYKELAERL